MLRTLALSSTIFGLLLMAPLIYVLVIRARSVKKTDRHHIAKSCEIALVVLYMMTQLVSYFSMQLFIGGVDMRPKMRSAVWPMICLLLCGKWLQYLLLSDDDDWFHDEWKSMKNWLKKFRPKLVPLNP